MNDIKLQEGHPIDENLRPVKVGGKSSALEISTDDVRTKSLEVSGDLNVKEDIAISSYRSLYLDGGGDTYIQEKTGDDMVFYAGGDQILTLSENDSSGNVIQPYQSCIGFTAYEANANSVSSTVDFYSNGHKAHITLDTSPTNFRLRFPNVSGNFILVLIQDGTGSRTITNYLSQDQDAGNLANVYWSGGTKPTLSTAAGAVDIISIYWDNTNHKAYAVATLNFSQP